MSDSFDHNAGEEAEDRAIARALSAHEEDGTAMDDTIVDEYRQVLAHLPFEEVAPPPDLEARVVQAARARRAPALPTLDRWRQRRSAARWATFGGALAAAAAVVVFALASGDDDGGGQGGRIETAADSDAVAGALGEEGTRTAALGDVGRAALTAEGNGFLYDLELEPGTYTLWLRTDGDAVRLGVLPDTPGDVLQFEVTGDVAAVRGVFVTTGESAEPVVASADF